MAKPRSEFGKRINRLRAEHDMTASQFAATIGYSKGYQSDVEHGQRGPSLNYVNAIVESFNVSRRTWHRAACRQLGWDI